MPSIAILAINIIDEKITILFDHHWFQEDIAELRQLLLAKIPEHHVKETTLGADRECVRLQWLHAEFILNFDCYSQSCWFSAYDDVSTSKIQPLFNLLTQPLDTHV